MKKEIRNRFTVMLIYAFLLFAIGCGAKKKVSEKVSIKKDSVISRVSTVEVPPISSEFTIMNLCDSLEQLPVQFKKIFVVDRDTIYVETVDNELRFKYQSEQRITKELRDSLRSIRTVDKDYSQVTKYRIPSWAWFVMIGELIVILIAFKVWKLFI